jgi:hypothetical protein
MNKKEAIKMMLEGHKVTHESFRESDYLHMMGTKLLDEDNMQVYWDEFWDTTEAADSAFEEGWYLYYPKDKTNEEISRVLIKGLEEVKTIFNECLESMNKILNK